MAGSHMWERGTNRFFPELPQNSSLADTLTSDLWPLRFERTHSCCFKPPSSWAFVTPAPGHYCRSVTELSAQRRTEKAHLMTVDSSVAAKGRGGGGD